MRTIRLYGELGSKFGETFKLAVDTVGEAVRALSIQIPGFQKYLMESEKAGVGFRVLDSGNALTEKELILKGNGEIKIVPVISGANGETRVLLGAVLIAASFVMTATGYGAGAAPYVMNAGVALAIGGAIEMLVGRPKAPEIGENAENKPSYVFNGAVNTTAQGHPVPLGYGRLRVGSAVISASITTKSLMAGYRRIVVEKYVDLVSGGTEDSFPYDRQPPAGWTRKELIDSGVASGTYSIQWWKWRFFYNETHLELVPV